MESLGVHETYDGREFWRNAAEVGRYVNSICQKQTIKAKNKSCREFLHLRYSWLAFMHATVQKVQKWLAFSRFRTLWKPRGVEEQALEMFDRGEKPVNFVPVEDSHVGRPSARV